MEIQILTAKFHELSLFIDLIPIFVLPDAVQQQIVQAPALIARELLYVLTSFLLPLDMQNHILMQLQHQLFLFQDDLLNLNNH